MVKLVWYYNNALGRPKKKKIFWREPRVPRSHRASASLTGLPNNHRDFDLPIDNILHVDCPHWYRFGQPGESRGSVRHPPGGIAEKRILSEGPDTVARLIGEPVMGAGGVSFRRLLTGKRSRPC